MAYADAGVERLQSDLSNETKFPDWVGADFRYDLAFPQLTDDMIQRVRPYGREEVFPANTTLYTHGDRQTDMFVIIDGSVDSFLPDMAGGRRIYRRHRKSDFTGEFNLLTAQGAVVEARTVTNSVLLRISRRRLQHLMRAEGDIANLIVQAAIWRRIGVIKAASGGVVLVGQPDEGETSSLQRFLVRNSYPHRIVASSADYVPRIGNLTQLPL